MDEEFTPMEQEMTVMVSKLKFLLAILTKQGRIEEEYHDLLERIKFDLLSHDTEMSPFLARKELLLQERDAIDNEEQRITAQLVVPRERKKRIEKELNEIEYKLCERSGELFRHAMSTDEDTATV
jgi:hypothetical protein